MTTAAAALLNLLAMSFSGGTLTMEPAPEPAPSIAAMSVAERRAWLSGKSKEEIAQALDRVSPAELLDAGQRAVKELGAYTATLVKEERVDGELRPAQTLKMLLRESPFAARLDYVAGPAKGRKVLYDSTTRPKDIRVREAGMLGFVGALWLALDNSMAKRDTNHTILELGLGALMRLMQKDVDAARAFGGLERKAEGFDKNGRYCVVYSAPAKSRGLYAQKTRVCMDTDTLLPMEVQVHDGKGLLETYVWSDVKQTTADEKTFSLEAAGL